MAERDLATLSRGRQTEETNEVVILPVLYNRNGTGVINSPHPWTDYEEVVIGMGIGTFTITFGTGVFTKSEISANPTGARTRVDYTDASFAYTLAVDMTGTDTAIWTGNRDGLAHDVYPAFFIGYRKKYATTNLTEIISVNGGADVAVNTRYEILGSSLPASFLKPNGDIKENVEVRAELYYDGTLGGTAGWGTTGFSGLRDGGTGTATTNTGVYCSVLGNMIIVQTAEDRLLGSSNQWGNPFGMIGSVTSAPCQVIATLAGEAYTVQTA